MPSLTTTLLLIELLATAYIYITASINTTAVLITALLAHAYVVYDRYVHGIQYFMNNRRNAKQLQQWHQTLQNLRTTTGHHPPAESALKAGMVDVHSAAEDVLRSLININKIALPRQYIYFGRVYRSLHSYYTTIESAASWSQRRRLPSAGRFKRFVDVRNQLSHSSRYRVEVNDATYACDILQELLAFAVQ